MVVCKLSISEQNPGCDTKKNEKKLQKETKSGALDTYTTREIIDSQRLKGGEEQLIWGVRVGLGVSASVPFCLSICLILGWHVRSGSSREQGPLSFLPFVACFHP